MKLPDGMNREQLASRAEAGDKEAQYEFGEYLLAFHEREPRNSRDAILWLSKAGKQGHLRAIWTLAHLPDSALAATGWDPGQWLKWGAECGDPLAKTLLALIDLRQAQDAATREKMLEKLAPLAVNDYSAVWEVASLMESGAFGVPDPARATAWLRQMAVSGNDHIKEEVGKALFTGRRGEPNTDEAVAIFRLVQQPTEEVEKLLAFVHECGGDHGGSVSDVLASTTGRAEDGDVEAARRLGGFYGPFGGSFNANIGLSAHFYRIASDRGDVSSTVAGLPLGGLYGVAEDDAKALMQRALELAEAGNADAQFALWARRLHLRRQNLQWLEKAARQGHDFATVELAQSYTYGIDGVTDYEQGLHFATQAAKAGWAEGHVLLAQYYANGWFMDVDFCEAVRHYRRALSEDHDDAATLLALADLLARPDTPVFKPSEALQLYRNLAEGNDEFGMVRIGRCYEVGLGVERDVAEAARWYQHVFDNQDPYDNAMMTQAEEEAGARLGRMYETGVGKPRDPRKARHHYRQSGTPEALEYLGGLFERGEGGPMDNRMAFMAFRQAEELGSQHAKGKAERVRGRLDPSEAQQAEQERDGWYARLKDEEE